jgi:hypothetical protein
MAMIASARPCVCFLEMQEALFVNDGLVCNGLQVVHDSLDVREAIFVDDGLVGHGL